MISLIKLSLELSLIIFLLYNNYNRFKINIISHYDVHTSSHVDIHSCEY
jgi:hypothetical protein